MIDVFVSTRSQSSLLQGIYKQQLKSPFPLPAIYTT